MRIEIALKGEIPDNIFEKVKKTIETLKDVMEWYKLDFKHTQEKFKEDDKR